MRKYGLLKFFQRISSLNSNACYDNQLRRRISQHVAADDFAFFCKEVPSVYFNIGCTDFSKGSPAPAHNEKFNPEETIPEEKVMKDLGITDDDLSDFDEVEFE